MNDRWDECEPIRTASTRGWIVEFCESKHIDFGDLAAMDTRCASLGGEDKVWLAWANHDDYGNVTAIKYRNVVTGERKAEAGSTFDRPMILGNRSSLEWYIVEGETDAARLLGMVENGAIMVLPAGAATFKPEWAAIVPRGAMVYLCYDSDPAGEKGAEKARRMLCGGIRLRPPAKDWCEWDGGALEFPALIEEAREQDTDTRVISMYDALIDFEEEVKNPPDLSNVGVPTPFSFLPRMMPGRVYVLAGYTKDGKTALAGQFIGEAAEASKRVLLYSIEMAWRDIRDRFIASRGVPYGQVQARVIAEGLATTCYKRALTELALWDVSICDDPAVTPNDIRAYLMQNPADLVVIDHLHRFKFKERRDLEEIMRQIVNLSKEFDVPILLLAQLKRPFGTDKAPRPTLSMLRESGMIEAEAAMVSFVFRPRTDEGLRSEEDAEYIVAANRFGPEMLKPLTFDPEHVRFKETTIYG